MFLIVKSLQNHTCKLPLGPLMLCQLKGPMVANHAAPPNELQGHLLTGHPVF